MHILGSSYITYCQVYPQTTLLVPHMYTKIQVHQHKIIQLAWIHMVHTCGIRKLILIFLKPATSMSQLLISPANLFPDLFMPYIDFFGLNGLTKYLQYSGKYSPYLLPNFKKIICLKFAFRNAPMKYNWCNLALFWEASTRKYFRVLIDSIGDQVSPIIYFFYKSPLTTIINFNLSIPLSDCTFSLYTSIHGVTGYPFLGSSIRSSDC